MRNMGRILQRLAIVLFWPAVIVVTWGELTPSPPPLALHVWDKLLHFTAYFGLAGLAALSLKSRRALIYAVLGLILFGGLLEVIQGFTGRDAEWGDEFANTLGAIVGAFSGSAFLRLVDRPTRG
ncbi:MAG: VanZ family protein [Rhizomicrobium sp.]